MTTGSRKTRIVRSALAFSIAVTAAIVGSALPFASTSTHAQSSDPYVDAARAHAAPYADPNYYTQPAVVDVYQDIFLGRPTSQTNPSYNTGDASPAYAAERQTVACYGGNCAPAPPGRAEICASAYSGSFLKIGVGDTFYIGKLGIDGSPAGNTPDATKARTHAVVSIAPGTGAANCAVGTWILTVYPWIDYVAEGVTNGASLSPVWRDALHPTGGAAYLIGYKLGSDTRDTWGAQRRNPISNPGFQGDANGIVQGWTVTPGTINAYPYDLGNSSTKPSAGAACNSGEGVGYTTGTPGYDCVAPSAAQDAEIVQTSPVSVIAGERYILSGLISTESTAAYYGLADDRDGNGTWTLSPDLRVTLTDPQVKTSMNRVPRWFSSVVTIPAGVSAVKFLYHAASSTDWLDYASIRKQTGSGDSVVTPNYLMNDPGSRKIVFMGDSWFAPGVSTPYVPYFKQGLLDAFAARGISIPPGQMVATGVGGDLTLNILMRLPSVLATYHPLYIVLDGGINDAYQDPVAEDTMANLREIARLCVQAGAIPIFLSPPPAVRLNGTLVFGDGSTFAVLHTLRESLRNWAFALDGDGCGAPDGVLFSTCGTGSCTRAAATCVAGVPEACVPGAPQAEVCNGLDDDCNGVIDDGGGSTLCNDGNACTDDVCGGTAGCGHTNNSATCDDGDLCTTGDACGGGTCHAGPAVVCDDKNACTADSCISPTGCVFIDNANGCDDDNACTTNGCIPATGACVFTNNSSPCNDGNPCTTGDACGGGTCQPGTATVCNDSNVCTTDSCNPATGCVFANNTNVCNDGSACTVGDLCGGGTCNPGTPITCNDNDACTTDGCNPATGTCVFTNNTSPCDDGNPCTTGDACGGGTCQPGTATVCNDSNVCTTDSCNPATGCVFANNTSACSDGSACTSGDHCGGGTCLPGTSTTCNDSNACTTDACNPSTGACFFTNNTNPCNDGNPCTANDACGGGSCHGGGPTDCSDNNPCTDDSCSPSNGCKHSNDNSNTCSDDNACTTGDECRGGSCRPGTATVCSDNNVCTTDSCNPTTGACVFTNNTSACSDGNACTTGDVCGGGACMSGAPTVCNDNNVCTTDSCNPASGCVFANNTNPCSDGSACTTGDACGGGSCVPGAPTVCNDNNVCTTDSCNPATGACVFTNNTSPCSDGNACTTGDACGGGTCNPGTPTVCNDAKVCTTDSCNPATGCVFTNNTNPCSDGSACTTGDTCGGGVCIPGTPTVCNDSNVCTTDSCNPANGNCVFANNTNSCNDGNACTTGDVCNSGKCRPGAPTVCNDNKVCTTDSCSPVTGCVFTNNTNPCNDGNACTTGDTCSGGSCNPGTPTVCNDSNACTTDSCSAATGCVFANNTNPCNDGNACTTGDVCGGGTCHPGNAIVCNDNNVCTTDSCIPATGCAFTNNSNPCTDGNACTTGDICGGGTCQPGAPIVCGDGNVCTTDSCNPATGCVFTNNTSPCSDGSACTTGDSCGGGTCNPGTPIDCSDGNVCTTESCNPQTGACVHTNNTGPCNDDNPCTTGDVCGGGVCQPGAPTVCNDNNVCTTDSCLPATGCAFTSNSNPCSDGNACTTGDVCGGGTCHSVASITCNDGNSCTTDSCDAAIGCVFANNTNPCDDGNACTQGDACQSGSCLGIPPPGPSEVDDGVRLSRSASDWVVTWNLAPGATSSDLLRGSLSALPVGPGAGDEACLGNVTGTALTDGDVPPVNGGFWYLVRGVDACQTKGPWGSASVRGAPGLPRSSTTCP